MNLRELRSYLDTMIGSLTSEDQSLLKARLEKLVSVFPFNEYEFILTFLVDRRIISFSDYEDLRRKYVSANRYLDLFGLAPRIFGEVWAQQHLMALDSRFKKPDKSLDPDYQGHYDLWLEGLRVEVKAARAIATKERSDLVSKALRRSSEEPFWMNFQQLKLETCDVFIFVGVWVDEIAYWVMSTEEVKENRYFSHQHRGGIEYQIGIRNTNIHEFDNYKVEPTSLYDAVKSKGKNSSV